MTATFPPLLKVLLSDVEKHPDKFGREGLLGDTGDNQWSKRLVVSCS